MELRTEVIRSWFMCPDLQTTFRKCADNGKEGGRERQAENVQLRLMAIKTLRPRWREARG